MLRESDPAHARAAIENWNDELTRRAIGLLATREASLAELEHAVAAVPGAHLVTSLDRVTSALPLAVSVETASIRVRDTDGGRELHHLSAVGLPTHDRRRLSVDPISIARARAVIALGARHSVGRALGLRWLHGVWLQADDERIGVLFVGSRTQRRPSEDELDALQEAADALALRLAKIDRSLNAIRRASVEVARSLVANQLRVPDDKRLAGLRPRERAILDLYADGMSTADIVELLVLSPHTVRTHVKNVLRRLGVHSREEAIEMIRRDRVTQLI